MNELTGIAKIIFDELMDEIEEELEEALSEIISEEKLFNLVKTLQENTKQEVIEIINENYSEEMNSVKKMILGEKLSRIVTREARKVLEKLSLELISLSMGLIETLRNEIIGEVFEETE
ncbi:MAG: hypothetical protein K9W45_00110 [Candidatus Heimdallarchaeum aukensis]|uniref:Uncharacterized protein n=1 Tax=Candidatus Heimdallarchaeum aukensis TaxID=2876573 RepID=A0A9Y1BKS8_9ARCH|nr:MAG: hypothetical protein K9W45_00110 [Candidatus Heimdallarchaeum aukensis]